jgi:hypothetical protein
MVAGNFISLLQNHGNLKAWVTQMFTIRKIGYTVSMAFVIIMVEV